MIQEVRPSVLRDVKMTALRSTRAMQRRTPTTVSGRTHLLSRPLGLAWLLMQLLGKGHAAVDGCAPPQPIPTKTIQPYQRRTKAGQRPAFAARPRLNDLAESINVRHYRLTCGHERLFVCEPLCIARYCVTALRGSVGAPAGATARADTGWCLAAGRETLRRRYRRTRVASESMNATAMNSKP